MKNFDIIKKLNLTVGTELVIKNVSNHPEYAGREGTIINITNLGHLQGTWGGLALVPSVDKFEVKNKK